MRKISDKWLVLGVVLCYGMLAWAIGKYGLINKSVVIGEVSGMETETITETPKSEENVNKELLIETNKCSFTVDERAEKRMIDLLEVEREERDLPRLKVDADVTQVARKHSIYMFTNDYFSHTDKQGKTVSNRLKEGDVSYNLAGENLAFAYSVEQAFESLMNSPEHLKNMLDARFVKVGIGAVNGGSCGMMFTQVFVK